MSDDKKARLDAIRAANAAKKAAEGGDSAPAPAAAEAVPAAVSATAAPAKPAAGASMSDEKKARLDAIRAAKAAGGDAPAAAATATAPAATPAAAATTTAPAAPASTAAAAAPRPAAAPAKPGGKDPTSIAANAIIDLSWRGTLLRIIAGAIFCGVIGLGLATITGDYLIGGVFGVFIGVVGGYMVGDWPASKTTGD